MQNKRRENREHLRRLFQSYVNDYGNNAGWKIIKTVIYELGGFRLWIPKDGSRKGEMIDCFYTHVCEEFGEASGAAIMQKFIMELGGLRISFPSFEDLYREERDRKIRAKFNGLRYNSNLQELADQWGIQYQTAWWIVRREKEKYIKACEENPDADISVSR